MNQEFCICVYPCMSLLHYLFIYLLVLHYLNIENNYLFGVILYIQSKFLLLL